MTIFIYSAGVRSYIRFRSCRLGVSCHFDSSVEPLPWINNSSGGATSFVTMLSRATLSVNLTLSQQTMTGMSAWLAIMATIALPALEYNLPLLIIACAPRNTFVASLTVWLMACMREYSTLSPRSAKARARFFPSKRGLESITITRNFLPCRNASRRACWTVLLLAYVRITSPSRIFSVALLAIT